MCICNKRYRGALYTPPAAKYVAQQNERALREDQDVAELMALISKMEIIERSSADPESQAAADRRLERIEKAIKKLYEELNLEQQYKAYEEQAYAEIMALKPTVKEVPWEVFEVFLNKIFKRSK